MQQGERLSLARRRARAIIIFLAIIFFGLLVYKNVAPFGATVTYKMDLTEGSENIAIPTPLVPSAALSRDKKGAYYQIPQQKMTTDQVTFDLKVPYTKFATAEVKIKYQGDPEEFLVGVRDIATGQCIFKPVHNKSLNALTWNRLQSNGLTLFQRKKRFASVGDFIANPPVPKSKKAEKARIATYHYEFVQRPRVEISKVNEGTEIDASLRGPHTFYIYVKDQPLEFALNKQDINWYEGPDPLNINIFSGSKLIHSQIVPDDGDASNSGKPSKLQKVEVMAPDLKEGVYKIVLECGVDVVIKDLESQQKYLCFEEKVFLADHDLYKIGPTKENTLYTNGKKLSAMSWHMPGLQTLHINDNRKLVLNKENESFSVNLGRETNKIVTEKGDIVLSSEGGYFAFSKDSLFDPIPVKTAPYSKDLVLTDIDYIVADYTIPAKRKGVWRTNSVTIDLTEIEAKDNKLNFVLHAPGLTGRGEEIVLGSIEITLKKPGLL
ncbi:MAG: hypothetical protein QMD66_01360 [Actinomycetota bacterium]|nr:hypothetical protein [Actinomycetota bacterium]